MFGDRGALVDERGDEVVMSVVKCTWREQSPHSCGDTF